jgi:hypothetical protein
MGEARMPLGILILTIILVNGLFLVTMVEWRECQRLEREGDRLRRDLRDLESDMDHLRRLVQPPIMKPPIPSAPSSPPSKKQIQTVVRDLRRWSSELEEDADDVHS